MQLPHIAQPVNPGEQIIREIKLKVFKRHFETALSETMEMKKALLDAPPEKRESMEAKLNALRGFAEQLEKDIHSLAGQPASPGSLQYRTHQDYINPAPKDQKTPPLQGPKAPAYAPGKATGAADAGDSGNDSRDAWCPASASSPHEWLHLSYGKEMEVSGIHIYETSASGSLSRVVAVSSNEKGHHTERVLWNGKEPVDKMPFVRIINTPSGVRANGVRLEFEPRRIHNWQEIDAVLLTAADGSHQWAKSATASSYWGQGTPSVWEKPETFRIAGAGGWVAEQWRDDDPRLVDPAQPNTNLDAPPAVADPIDPPTPPPADIVSLIQPKPEAPPSIDEGPPSSRPEDPATENPAPDEPKIPEPELKAPRVR
jgi:hypothetical protein